MYVMYSRELARDASRHSRDNQLQVRRCNNDGSLCGVVNRPCTLYASVLGVLLRRQASSILSKWSPPVQRHHIRITTRNTNVHEIIKMQLIHLYNNAKLYVGIYTFHAAASIVYDHQSLSLTDRFLHLSHCFFY